MLFLVLNTFNFFVGTNERLEEETKCIHAGLLSPNGWKPAKDSRRGLYLYL